MKSILKAILYPLLCWFSLALSAEPLAIAELVQEQAWVERGGATLNLRPGMALQGEDTLRTGEKARVVLRLHDQSVVKLGERAQVRVEKLLPPAQKGDGAQGTLHVLFGAFRYTAEKAAPARKLELKVGDSLTMGIRGTDVWGKSDQEKALVCLLKGKVSARAGETEALLDQPRHFFVVPQGQAPLPVSFQEEAKIAEWAVQTEPYPKQP
jgi:hypothetical protein